MYFPLKLLDFSFRYTGSNKITTDDEDDEDFDRTFTSREWRGGSPKRWSSSPLKSTDLSRDRNAKGPTSDFLVYQILYNVIFLLCGACFVVRV